MNNEFEKLENKIEKEFRIVKGDSLSTLEIPKSEFVIEGMIAKNTFSILAGNPANCKSWVLLELAKALGTGTAFFDKFEVPKKLNVLYIDEESSLSEIKRRWFMLDSPNCNVSFMSLQNFRLDNNFNREELKGIIREQGFEFIIFDSLRDIWMGDENSSRDVQLLVNGFKELIQEGTTILVSHHLRKETFGGTSDLSQKIRGSGALLSSLDGLIALETTKKNEDLFELNFSPLKLREGKLLPNFRVNLTEIGDKMEFQYVGEVEDATKRLERAKIAIKEVLSEGEKYQSEIIEILIPHGHTTPTLNRAFKEMKESDEFSQRVGEKRRIYLGLKE